jgi:hypothetical protein
VTAPGWLQPWEGSSEGLLEATSGHTPVWWLRGSRMRTKRGLLDEWAAAAQFPPHFGGTWDALRDALTDLPEGGTFLVLEADQLLQDAPPEDARLWLSVMTAVAEELAPRPFQLVLQADSIRFPELLTGLSALGLS